MKIFTIFNFEIYRIKLNEDSNKLLLIKDI